MTQRSKYKTTII